MDRPDASVGVMPSRPASPLLLSPEDMMDLCDDPELHRTADKGRARAWLSELHGGASGSGNFSSFGAGGSRRPLSTPAPEVYVPGRVYAPPHGTLGEGEDRASTVSLPLPRQEPVHTLPAIVGTAVPEGREAQFPSTAHAWPSSAPTSSSSTAASTAMSSESSSAMDSPEDDDLVPASPAHYYPSLGHGRAYAHFMRAAGPGGAGADAGAFEPRPAAGPGFNFAASSSASAPASFVPRTQPPAPIPSSSSLSSGLPPPPPPQVYTPPPPSATPRAPHDAFLCREPAAPNTWVAVQTTEHEYLLHAHLPGFRRDSITLSTRRRRVLHIVAEGWENGGGHFERRISFGYDAELARVKAEFDGDMLRLVVPRRAVRAGYCGPAE